MDIDLTLWTFGAVSVVGILEWAKGLYDSVKAKTWKSVVFSGALPAVSIGVAALKGGADVAWNCAGIWSITQLGYALIVQTVTKRLKGAA